MKITRTVSIEEELWRQAVAVSQQGERRQERSFSWVVTTALRLYLEKRKVRK